MSLSTKAVLPIAVILLGVAATVLVVQARPEVAKTIEAPLPPLVRVIAATSGPVRIDVTSQGTVRPVTEAGLVAEVSGRVVWVSPSFEAGGFADRGTELLSLDPRDYEAALRAAQAQLAQARVVLEREQAEARLAREEWRELGDGEPGPLVLREPQLAEATARLAAAEAAVDKARIDLDRTHVRAPFTGRVRTTHVDLGEFVNRGMPLAVLYSVDAAEIRLPLPDAELAFLELGDAYLGRSGAGPRVLLTTEFAGTRHEWTARIVRAEGEIDATSRMVHLVARIEDPYALRSNRLAAPLAVGMFVQAEIEGRSFEHLVRLPRAALRGANQVWVVDPEGRLRFRTVDVLRREPQSVLIRAGLADGDRVCVSSLEAAVDGMAVRVAEDEPRVTSPARPSETPTLPLGEDPVSEDRH